VSEVSSSIGDHTSRARLQVTSLIPVHHSVSLNYQYLMVIFITVGVFLIYLCMPIIDIDVKYILYYLSHVKYSMYLIYNVFIVVFLLFILNI